MAQASRRGREGKQRSTDGGGLTRKGEAGQAPSASPPSATPSRSRHTPRRSPLVSRSAPLLPSFLPVPVRKCVGYKPFTLACLLGLDWLRRVLTAKRIGFCFCPRSRAPGPFYVFSDQTRLLVVPKIENDVRPWDSLMIGWLFHFVCSQYMQTILVVGCRIHLLCIRFL